MAWRFPKGKKLIIVDSGGERHEGTSLGVENAIWRPRRKSEPTLRVDIGNGIMAFPIRYIERVDGNVVYVEGVVG